MASVTAVIPNHNRRNLLAASLASLSRQTCPPEEIVVVDNGSDDDSVKVAKKFGARVIQLDRNTGFASAVNRGVRQSQSDLIAVVNNDVEFDGAWLARLRETLVSGDYWFATGKIQRWDERGVLDGTYDAVARSGCTWRCGEGRPDGASWSEPCEIGLAPLTASLFRRDLFERVGLLDEEFGSYLEDIDFGLRCAAGNLRGRYVPFAVAYHHGSATLGRWHPETVRLLSRNQVLLVARHYPERWWRTFGWPVFIGQLLWLFVAARHGRGLPAIKGKLQGLRLYRRLRMGHETGNRIGKFLRESEEMIRALQQDTGFDRYWRLYFALT